MTAYRIRRAALADLDAIAEFIHRDDPDRAATFIEELMAKLDVVAHRPMSFPHSADLPTGVRSALHGRYRILFEVVESVPHILRIVHGARDIGRLFDEA